MLSLKHVSNSEMSLHYDMVQIDNRFLIDNIYYGGHKIYQPTLVNSPLIYEKHFYIQKPGYFQSLLYLPFQLSFSFNIFYNITSNKTKFKLILF